MRFLPVNRVGDGGGEDGLHGHGVAPYQPRQSLEYGTLHVDGGASGHIDFKLEVLCPQGRPEDHAPEFFQVGVGLFDRFPAKHIATEKGHTHQILAHFEDGPVFYALEVFMEGLRNGDLPVIEGDGIGSGIIQTCTRHAVQDFAEVEGLPWGVRNS